MDVSSDGLLDLYNAVGRDFEGKVFALIDKRLRNSCLVDKLAYFKGAKTTLDDNGYEKMLPVGFYGNLQGENYIKDSLTKFNSVIVISRFERIGGVFGGGITNLSLSTASKNGVTWIKSSGFTKDEDVMFHHTENTGRYAESLVEACKSVVEFWGSANLIYLNVICLDNRPLCAVAGVDPVAVDKASLDIVLTNEKKVVSFTAEDGMDELRHVLDYAEKLGLGDEDYNLIEI